MPTRGLTLGKYAPLHAGHRLVIDTALGEVSELVVVVYDSPSTTRVPLAVRADWVRRLYPTARVVEAWDGPEAVGYAPELMRAHERYVRDVLGLRDITHFYSSEPYGEHMSAALGAVDRRVDPGREQVPVSATAVRADPFANRGFLAPLVYRDLIVNVAILGAPSTGKSTLAERLASEHHTRWMPEHGRAFWHHHQRGRRLSPAQLVTLAREHLEREDAQLEASNRVLFTDTSAISTLTFARYYHGVAPDDLVDLADSAARRYDLTFVCDTDIPYEDTWDRSGPVRREAFQRQVVADLAVRNVPFVLIRGDLDTRVARVQACLAGFEKYSGLSVHPASSPGQGR